MKLANERSDRGPEDQSEARRDGGPWQPPRVTVSQSPCPGSSLWQTPDQDRWGRANCSCHLPKRGKFMVVFLFNISFFWRWKVHFYARKHNSLTMNEYLFFRPPPFRQERIIFSIMRPGARRHSIAVGFSSSSGSGFGNWHEFSQITLQRHFTHITPGQAEEGGRVWPIALTTSQKHSLKEI